jgi:hypothetical protein
MLGLPGTWQTGRSGSPQPATALLSAIAIIPESTPPPEALVFSSGLARRSKLRGRSARLQDGSSSCVTGSSDLVSPWAACS